MYMLCLTVMLLMFLYHFQVRLNAGRTITGILRGFDPYMNLVLDDCVEERSTKDKFNIGLVVCIEQDCQWLK